MKPVFVLYLLIMVTYSWINNRLLLTDPEPWSDEAVYADIAVQWLRTGRLTSTLWQGMIPGVDSMVAWNPPAHFLVTAVSFNLLGVHLWSQRLLSFIAGLGCVLLLLKIARELMPHGNQKLLGLLALLLLTDYQFMRSTRIARAEIIVLSIGLIGWWWLLRWRRRYQVLNQRQSWLIGLWLGLAPLFHPLGLGMVAIPGSLWLVERFSQKKPTLKLPALVTGALLPLVGWLIAMWPYRDTLFQQILLATERKNVEMPWVGLVFENHVIRAQIVFILLGLVLLWLITKAVRSRDLTGVWVALLALGFSLLSVVGRMMWYTAYALPFIYLAFTYWFQQCRKNERIPRYLISGVIVANLWLPAKNTLVHPISHHQYSDFCERLLQKIPDYTTVFMSAVPDPYYCFLENHRHNRLLQFPVLTLPLPQYGALLHQADYVIYEVSYNSLLFGDYLERYLQANTLSSYPIQDRQTIYSATVIRLSPPSGRVLP